MSDVSVRVEMAAPAEAIDDLVADMPRMGEWSLECERVEWRGGATGFEATPSGTCLVIESTTDRRGALIRTAGRLATGVSDRAQRNRETMATTLDRLRTAAESVALRRATPTA
jgi:hypothetical protein